VAVTGVYGIRSARLAAQYSDGTNLCLYARVHSHKPERVEGSTIRGIVDEGVVARVGPEPCDTCPRQRYHYADVELASWQGTLVFGEVDAQPSLCSILKDADLPHLVEWVDLCIIVDHDAHADLCRQTLLNGD